MSMFGWLYALSTIGLAVFGFNMLLLVALAVWPGGRRPPARPLSDWPAVLVQLPIYNERYVVERLIGAACALDYPADRLTIQVLDDSTDDTTAIARACAAYHRARGRNIMYRHRTGRAGFKAGALAEGLAGAPGEFIAIFDADFLPPPDFLRRTLPDFYSDARLGMVQTRWEHLNPDQNLLTRAQALAVDGYFGIVQAARSRAGWLLNFNGSAGVWRRACLEDAGGWQGDTLAEDLDLSIRAQLQGWRMGYRVDVPSPAELPASILAFKGQQFRWAKGSFQVLRKLGPQLLSAPMPLLRKAQGFLHLCGYLAHPLVLASLLFSLPVVLRRGQIPLDWDWLAWAWPGPLLAVVLAQMVLRRDWPKRLWTLPVLVMVMTGLALSNTQAAWEAFFGRTHTFLRTPKYSAANPVGNAYALPLDWTTWGELLLALYAFVTGLLAVELAPGLAPFIFLYALGFGYTAALGFWQSGWVRGGESREGVHFHLGADLTPRPGLRPSLSGKGEQHAPLPVSGRGWGRGR